MYKSILFLRYEDEISQAIATKLSSTRISEKADVGFLLEYGWK